eukprot:6172942-Pleurochrysis_carterae.AAC.1
MSTLPDQSLLQTQEPLTQRPWTQLSAPQPVICQAVATVRRVLYASACVETRQGDDERSSPPSAGSGCKRSLCSRLMRR